MNTPLLVLDVHYLAHRAFHSSTELSWKGKPTSVIFGLLKSISALKDEFQTDRIAFCFEHPHLFRRDVYPEYKRKRNAKERTEEEKQSYESLAIQISELRQRYLPKIGFKNVFCFRGMESDDIMAAIALNTEEEIILITSDADLWQCLRSNVSIYSPQLQKMFTEGWFRKEYQLAPSKWAVVKAMAGCPSDEVPGIGGIGPVFALKYLRGELKEDSKAFQTIKSREARETVLRNRKLVKLPFEGCPVPEMQEDEVTTKRWVEVCGMLGMKSLAGRPPVATRRLLRG